MRRGLAVPYAGPQAWAFEWEWVLVPAGAGAGLDGQEQGAAERQERTSVVMGETKREQKELYLSISEERSYGYFHVNVRVTTTRYESGEGWVPYGLDDGWYGSGYQWSGVRLRCQGDEQSQARTGDGD